MSPVTFVHRNQYACSIVGVTNGTSACAVCTLFIAAANEVAMSLRIVYASGIAAADGTDGRSLVTVTKESGGADGNHPSGGFGPATPRSEASICPRISV